MMVAGAVFSGIPSDPALLALVRLLTAQGAPIRSRISLRIHHHRIPLSCFVKTEATCF